MNPPSDQPFHTITEGSTTLHVPVLIPSRGPASSDMAVFYNPVMSLNRDLSVLFFAGDRGIVRALDGLAATGVRGIRIMNETGFGATGEMHLNDHTPPARDLMRRNAAANGVEVTIHRRNLNALLAEQYFDLIDIDPFGSPTPFVPSAFMSVRNRGYLAVTATDTGALCGSYPRAGLRRYGFGNARSYLTHETGLRGLLGYLVRQAAVHDRFIEPVISQSVDHYYRVVVRVRNGARRADGMVEELVGVRVVSGGYETILAHAVPAGDRTRGEVVIPGPFYAGPLHSRGCLEEMMAAAPSMELANPRKVERLLSLYLDEADAPAWHYDTDRIASHLGRSSPPLARVIGELRELGHTATLTQFAPTGFKTDADRDTVMRVCSSL